MIKIFTLWRHNQQFYENADFKDFKLIFCEFSCASNLKLFFLDESTITYIVAYIFDVYKPYQDQKYGINRHICEKNSQNGNKMRDTSLFYQHFFSFSAEKCWGGSLVAYIRILTKINYLWLIISLKIFNLDRKFDKVS